MQNSIICTQTQKEQYVLSKIDYEPCFPLITNNADTLSIKTKESLLKFITTLINFNLDFFTMYHQVYHEKLG